MINFPIILSEILQRQWLSQRNKAHHREPQYYRNTSALEKHSMQVYGIIWESWQSFETIAMKYGKVGKLIYENHRQIHSWNHIMGM